LNLVERKAERERLDAERLARENQRLTQLGKPVLKSNEELEASSDKRPDIVLEQTAQILGDVLATPAASPVPAVARETPAPAARKAPARAE
jgi:hypothetical protein